MNGVGVELAQGFFGLVDLLDGIGDVVCPDGFGSVLAPPSGSRCARLPSFHRCSGGRRTRAIHGPLRLSRHPCRSLPYATIALGLLKGAIGVAR
ncbi:MAG TPA: hypothetical protein DCW62_02100 [Pseudomonas sp.]|nr:hypothetical protein [Pseudomonas sp.]